MSLRFLLGILASGLPEENNQSTHEEINVFRNGVEDFMNVSVYFHTPVKFHIGMLTISLLIGIAYGGYTTYNCWMEKNVFLGYIRNLVIALACRTFFSIVFDGAILLGSPLNVGGGNFLLSFEQICLNLVIAFWLTLNIYLHERTQRNFNNEPTLIIYQFGIPGVALFFAFVWIFTLQDQWPSVVWWIFLNPFTQWIVNSINLLYLFTQLALLANIIRVMMKITLDNDAVSLLRKISTMMGVLVLIFWLQFGLSIGRIPLKTPESYLYFFYLVDGLECALICLVLFFFNKWVLVLLNKVSSLILRTDGSTNASESNEILLTGGRGVVTIDSMFMTRESGRWKSTKEEVSRDVVYSNVIEPERLKKTLDLYKRLNIIPTNQVTTVEGEEFYDCQLQNTFVPENSESNEFEKRFGSLSSNVSNSEVLIKDKNRKSLKTNEQKQKKNAFYSSKYLILDSKESSIPKYLETRPSVSSMSGKGSFRDERVNKDYYSDLNTSMAAEQVRKWLCDNSEIMQKKEINRIAHPKCKEKKPETSNDKDSGSDTMRCQLELIESMTREKEDQMSPQKMILSAINSVVSSVFFVSNTNERKSLDKESTKSIEKFCEQNDSKPFEFHKTNSKGKETIQNISDDNLIHYDTEEKPIIPTEINSEKKTDFFEVKFIEKNESDARAEETEKRQDTDKKEFKSKEQVLESQLNGNKLADIRINQIVPSEHSNDSNFKVERDELSVLTDTERQEQNQMKCDTPSPRNDENLTSNYEPLKLTHTESYPKEPTKANENQIDKKTLDVIKNKSQTSDDGQLPSLESDVHGTNVPEKDRKISKENRTSGESADEFRYKTEIPVLGKLDGSEVPKSHPSLSRIVSDLRIEPAPTSKDLEKSEPESEKSVNQYITYSDLLKFRSERYNLATDQPNGVSKKLFGFSEVLSSTIGFLISASSSIFSTRKQFTHSEKHSESVVSEFESKEKLETKNVEAVQNEKSQEELFGNHQRTLSMPEQPEATETSSESEFSIERKRDSSSSAGSFNVDQYYSQIIEFNKKFYNQSNSVYEKHKKEGNILRN